MSPKRAVKHPAAGIPSGNERSGFTLIELVVVLAILAVISGVVIPIYIGTMNTVEVRNAKADLISTLIYVQELSVRESREYRMYFDKNEGAYWIKRLSGQKENEKQFEAVAEEWGMLKKLPKHMVIKTISARRDKGEGFFIACQPNGASDKVEITLRDERSLRQKDCEIRVLGPIGKIEVKE